MNKAIEFSVKAVNKTIKFDVNAVMGALNNSHDAGIRKAKVFGEVAQMAHAENPSGRWQLGGEGRKEHNQKTFPLTYAFLEKLCERNESGGIRGDVSEFAGLVRAFLSLNKATREAHLVPVDGEAQYSAKSPWQHLKNTLRPHKKSAARGTKKRAEGEEGEEGAKGEGAKGEGAKGEGAKGEGEVQTVAKYKNALNAINTWKSKWAAVLPADAMAELIAIL